MEDKTGSGRVLSSQILFSVWGREAGEAEQCLKNSAEMKKKKKMLTFIFPFKFFPQEFPSNSTILQHIMAKNDVWGWTASISCSLCSVWPGAWQAESHTPRCQELLAATQDCKDIIFFSSVNMAEHGEAGKALNRQAQGTRDCPNDFYQCDTNVERGIGDAPSSVSNSFWM